MTIQETLDAWKEENEPFGKELGYPDCCIKEFCEQPPELMIGEPSKIDQLRYNAGCIKGKFTGFIPCKRHAARIYLRVLKLKSLIKNRSILFQPFPFEGNHDFE